MPTHEQSADEQRASTTGARKKSRSRRRGKNGRGDPDAAWQQSGAKLRAAWEELSAGTAGEPQPPVLRGRNLQERITALLYVLDASGTGPASLARHLPPAPFVPGAEPAAPVRQVAAEEPPAARSAGNRNVESIELPLWGAAATTAYTAAQAAGGQGLSGRLVEAGRIMAAQGSSLMQTTGVLMAAAAAQVNPRAVSQTVGATALLGGLAYAWYSMFGRQEDENTAAYERLAEQTGMLTEDERAMLDVLRLSVSAGGNAGRSGTTSAFSMTELTELEALVAELERAGATPSAATTEQPGTATSQLLYSLPGVRIKRSPIEPPSSSASTTTTVAPESRQAYWTRRYEAAAEHSTEKMFLGILRLGELRTSTDAVAAPRESFPLADAWYTRMDELQLDTFGKDIREQIEALSTEAAHDPEVKTTLADLPAETWLHLGAYYVLFYRKILHAWGAALLSLDLTGTEAFSTLAQRLRALTGKLNADWGGEMIAASVLADLSAKNDLLAARTATLQTFNALNKQITEGLYNTTWRFSSDIPAAEVFWGQYSLSYVDKIELSAFTGDFLPTLKTLIASTVDYLVTPSKYIDLVKLYTSLSVLAVERLLAALSEGRFEDAYNYAVLDEELRWIIGESISGFWRDEAQDAYLHMHNQAMRDVWPLFSKLTGKLPPYQASGNSTEVASSASAMNQTESTPAVSPTERPADGNTTALTASMPPDMDATSIAPEHPLLVGAEWAKIFREREKIAPIPERFSAQKHLVKMLADNLNEVTGTLTAFFAENILNPNQYIDAFIQDALRGAGLENRWSADSPITVQERIEHHKPSGEIAGQVEYVLSSRRYTLRDIVMGLPRRDFGSSFDDMLINWPGVFPASLRERLLHIDEHADAAIAALFDTDTVIDRQDVLQTYQFLVTRAALAYIGRRGTVVKGGNDAPGQRYFNAVEHFLKKETQAETVEWHGSTLAGLVFIPQSTGEGKGAKLGVLLSLWDNSYYDVPPPGLALYQRKEGRTGSYSPSAQVENDPKFQAFIRRHQTIRTGKNPETRDNGFGYRAEYHDKPMQYVGFEKQETYTDFYPPFVTVARSHEALAQKLISLQRADLVALYDDLIYSTAEHRRAATYELVNSLAMMCGVMLMVGGVVLGGPALAWVAASMAATLLVDIVPHAVLYSQADDDEERALYMRSMVMAVAFELGGNVVGAAIEPLLKGAYRLTRLGGTAVRETLPDLYRLVREKLLQVIKKMGVRRLRKVKGPVGTISKESQDDLEQIFKSFDQTGKVDVGDAAAGGEADEIWQSRANEGAAQAPANQGAGSSRQSKPPSGAEQAPTLTGQLAMLVDVMFEMDKLNFKSNVRILTAWKKGSSTSEVVNTFYIKGTRRGDNVVVQLMTEGKDHSYLYFDESEWLQNLAKEAEQNNAFLMAYYDLDGDKTLTGLQINHKALTESVSKVPLNTYPREGMLVYASGEYIDSLKSSGVTFDDIQQFLENTHYHEREASSETTLSQTIKAEIEGNTELKTSLEAVPRWLDTPPAIKTADPFQTYVMKHADELEELGPDIVKFAPLYQDLPFRQTNPALSAELKRYYAHLAKNDPRYKVMASDFIRLRAKGNKSGVTLKQLSIVESSFNRAYDMTEKMAALLIKAKDNDRLRDRILAVLAKFLNTGDATILGEAYERLSVLAERLHKLAHYHVMETKLTRVVPMTHRVKSAASPTAYAYVFRRDPTARIMLVLPDIAESKDIHSTIIHEMAHHAVGAEDLAYIDTVSTHFPAVEVHHALFGTTLLEGYSAHAVLGRAEHTFGLAEAGHLKPLTEYDFALAQARVRHLPMARAYAKMNNADSLAILIEALFQNFSFRRVNFSGTGAEAWDITPTVVGATRATRSAEEEEGGEPLPEDDIIVRESMENVLAAFLSQSLDLIAADVLTDEEIEALFLEIFEEIDETQTTPTDQTTQ